MKINFTKKEYPRLIELLGTADWVLNAHSTSEDERPKYYAELIQKIYAHAKEMGFEHLIKYDKKFDGYFPTRESEDKPEPRKYIEEFEENTFWDELLDKLSRRGVISKMGRSEFFALAPEERLSLLCDAEDQWATEFEEYGLVRLSIDSTIQHTD